MTHRSRLGGISIDCKTDELMPAAGFWSSVLGGRIVPETNGRYAKLTDQGEIGVEVQIVDHTSRVHLDIETDDMAAEERRLVSLGARRVMAKEDWVVMEAPTGHRFCIVPAEHGDFATHAKNWGEA